MSMAIQVVRDELDEEWVKLILTAREMDISIDEVRSFLEKPTASIHRDK